MALQLKNGWVFLHIPRTGGQSIRRVLQNYDLLKSTDDLPLVTAPDWPFCYDHSDPNITPHATYSWIGVDPKQCFAFVRHPLQWYRSQWAFTLGKRGSIEAFIEQGAGPDAIDSVGVGNFVDWVEMRLEAYPEGMVSKLYKTYTEGIGFIGYKRTFVGDLQKITGITNLSVPLKNASPAHWLKEAFYPQELAERTAKAESWAMERFGYSLSDIQSCIKS